MPYHVLRVGRFATSSAVKFNAFISAFLHHVFGGVDTLAFAMLVVLGVEQFLKLFLVRFNQQFHGALHATVVRASEVVALVSLLLGDLYVVIQLSVDGIHWCAPVNATNTTTAQITPHTTETMDPSRTPAASICDCVYRAGSQSSSARSA